MDARRKERKSEGRRGFKWSSCPTSPPPAPRPTSRGKPGKVRKTNLSRLSEPYTPETCDRPALLTCRQLRFPQLPCLGLSAGLDNCSCNENFVLGLYAAARLINMAAMCRWFVSSLSSSVLRARYNESQAYGARREVERQDANPRRKTPSISGAINYLTIGRTAEWRLTEALWKIGSSRLFSHVFAALR